MTLPRDRSPQSALAASVLLLVVIWPGIACEEEPDLDLTLRAVVPPNEAVGVPLNVEPTFWFNKTIPHEVAFDADIDLAELNWPLTCTTENDGSILVCEHEEELINGQKHKLLLDLGPDEEPEYEGVFYTGIPTGPAYHLGEEMVVERVGNSDLAADLLGQVMAGDTTLVLVFHKFHPTADLLPYDLQFLLGRGFIRPHIYAEGGVVLDSEYGFTTSLPGTIQSDGAFRATGEYGVIPVSAEHTSVLMVLEDVEIGGAVDPDEGWDFLPEVRLSGAIPITSLEELVAAMPEWAEVVADLVGLVKPDLDLDGDGEDDACTLEISATGIRVHLFEEK